MALLAGTGHARAQTLSPYTTTTDGGDYNAGGYELSWTIGESDNETFAGSTNTLTQQFEQPELQVTTSALSSNSLCAGSTYSVSFTASGIVDPTNVFTAQLSSSSGSFSAPISIGTLTSMVSGTISVTIPVGTAASTGYRIRVVSSRVVFDGPDNGTNIVISNCVNTWLGGSSAWTTGGNWSSGTAPSTCSDNVVIPVVSSPNVYPIVGSAASVGALTINSGASMTLNANLNVCGNVTAGTSSAATITGSGALVLNGSSAQSMSGSLILNNLTVANTSGGITSTGSVTVNDGFVMTKGNFTNNGGTVTLVSNAIGDGYYDDFTSSTAGAYTGNMTVQRYIANAANGYRDLSSPVATTVTNLNSAYPVTGLNGVDCYYAYSPYPNVQKFEENYLLPALGTNDNFNAHWISYTALNNPLTAMMGISFRTDVGSAYTINFTGNPYTGTQTIPVTYTSAALANVKGWNFIGNPYPSPIKWSAVSALNSSLNLSGYYVFETSGEYTGSWSSYVNGVGTGGLTGTIATGQGFFVLVPSSGTFTMNSTVRVASTADPYQSALRSEVRLLLTNTINKDEIVAYAENNASGPYDPSLDAIKISAGSTISIAYTLSDEDYAIKAVNEFTPETVLPLTIQVAETGSYSLIPKKLSVNGLTAYLKDSTDQQNINYTSFVDGPITLSLNGGQVYQGRYSVVFKPNTTTGIVEPNRDQSKIYSYGHRVYVQRSSSAPATISVINTLGEDMRDITTQTSETDFDLPAIEPWYAIIKVTEGQKVTITKVLISNNQ